MKDDKAQREWDIYKRYRDDTADWRMSRDKNNQFYFNNQWDEAVGRKLENRGQKDLVINKIRMLLRMRVSMMIANKPMGKVFGVRKGDIEEARLLENFADWHLYNSQWQYHLEKAVMGQNKSGVHWLSVYDDPMADYARGELKIGNESYRYMFLDKAARQWDYGDAPRLINSKLMRPEDWLNTLRPAIRKTVDNDEFLQSILVPDDEIRWSGEHEHRETYDVGTPVTITAEGKGKDPGGWIRVLDIYEKVFIDVPVLLSPDGIPFAVGDPDLENGGFSEDLLQQVVDGALKEETIPQKRIKFHTNISGKHILALDETKKKEDILPIEDYPLVPVIDEDTDNSMPLGEVDFQKGIQEVYNMCISLTLLNASLSSNMKLLVDAGKAGITNIEQFQNRWAVPGGVHDIKTDPMTGDFPIKEIRPEPLTQAWFTMAQALAQEIEFQSSRGLSLRSGDPTNAPETFAATLQLGQWAQDILRIPLSRLELALERVYNVLFQWAPTYYSFAKIFYTFREDGTATEQTINFAIKEQVNARFRIRAGSTMPSQTVAELGIMQNLAQINPALIGSVIDRLPGVSDVSKQEMKQTIDLVSQLQQQNAGLEEVNNVLQQQIQHLSEQVFAFQRESAIEPLKREVDVLTDRFKQANKTLNKAKGNGKK